MSLSSMLILLSASNMLSSSLADPFFQWRADDKRLLERISSRNFHWNSPAEHTFELSVVSWFASQFESTRPRSKLISSIALPLSHTFQRLALKFGRTMRRGDCFRLSSLMMVHAVRCRSLSDRFLDEIRSGYFSLQIGCRSNEMSKTFYPVFDQQLLVLERFAHCLVFSYWWSPRRKISSLLSNPLLKWRKDLLRALAMD